jgi:PAS domain S-box-containing protein
MECKKIIADLKDQILTLENKCNEDFRKDFYPLYDLIEQLETHSIPHDIYDYYNELSTSTRKQIEDAVKVTEEKLRIVIRNANALIFIINKEGIITLSDGNALDLFKLLPNQIIGLSIYDIFDDKPNIKRDIQKALAGTTTSSIMEIQEYTFETTFSPFSDTEANIAGAVAIAINVTERVKMQKEKEELIENLKLSSMKIMNDANKLLKMNDTLISSEEKLKKLNEEKDKFISIISHDLRSPFGGILGIADNLLFYYDRYKPSEIKSSLEMLCKTGHHLFDLLENLLVWARVNRGKIEVIKEKIPLHLIVKTNIELLINNAIPKKINIENNVEKNISIIADENMINTVIRNLISNAIKFTRIGGKIEISTNKTECESKTEIRICDNGVGMSKEIADGLFHLKKHHTSLGTNNEKGTGLGLLICKEMIDKNDGNISVDSKEGEGTCFSIILNSVINEELDCGEDDVFITDDIVQNGDNIFDLRNESLNSQKDMLKAFYHEIENTFLPRCKEVVDTQILGYIREFAEDLLNAAKQHDFSEMVRYSETLIEKVKIMDVVAMNKLLDYFTIFANKIKEHIDE